MAIAWVLRRNEVASAIVGARKPHQIEQTVLASDRVFDESSLEEVQRLIKTRKDELDSIEGAERARV